MWTPWWTLVDEISIWISFTSDSIFTLFYNRCKIHPRYFLYFYDGFENLISRVLNAIDFPSRLAFNADVFYLSRAVERENFVKNSAYLTFSIFFFFCLCNIKSGMFNVLAVISISDENIRITPKAIIFQHPLLLLLTRLSGKRNARVLTIFLPIISFIIVPGTLPFSDH